MARGSGNRGAGRRGAWRRRLPAAALLGPFVFLVLAAAFLATMLALPAAPGPSPSPTELAVASTTPESSSAGTEGPTESAAASPSSSPLVSPSATSSPAPRLTPSPTARSTASPTQTPPPGRTASPTATPGARSVYVTNGSRSSGKVALTFDFGGRIGDALAIVDYLVTEKVHASVFITGQQIDTTAEGPAVLARLCPLAGQFSLGNHSYTHPSFSDIPASKMRTELATTEAAFARHCSRSPRPYFRPPNGALGGWQTAKYYEILDTVGAAGYGRTVCWDIDTLDWGAPGTSYYQTADRIVARVQANVKGGSIVLMHLGGYNTLAAVQRLVPWLRDRGYGLVSLAELGI